MSELAQVITILEQHRSENRSHFDRMEGALTELSRSTALLANTQSRMEERHARQDDAMRRMGKQVDDHESRLRQVENTVTQSQSQQSGGRHTIHWLFTGATTLSALTLSLLAFLK